MCNHGRVVKAADLKSAGVPPRRFEPCWLREGAFCLHRLIKNSILFCLSRVAVAQSCVDWGWQTQCAVLCFMHSPTAYGRMRLAVIRTRQCFFLSCQFSDGTCELSWSRHRHTHCPIRGGGRPGGHIYGGGRCEKDSSGKNSWRECFLVGIRGKCQALARRDTVRGARGSVHAGSGESGGVGG